GWVKRWPSSAAEIAIERELRDHEEIAALILNRQVHLSGFVFEDAQPQDFFCEVVRCGFVVGLGDAQQDQQAMSDLADSLAFHRHTTTSDPLNHGSHGGQ